MKIYQLPYFMKNYQLPYCMKNSQLPYFMKNYQLPYFIKNYQLPYFMKIRLLGAEYFLADGQTDRWTGMPKFIIAFRNFAKSA